MEGQTVETRWEETEMLGKRKGWGRQEHNY